MGTKIDADKFFVDFDESNGVMIGTSYLEKVGTVLLTFFDSGDIQAGEGQTISEDMLKKAKGFMSFSDIQQIANFMEVLQKASKPLIEDAVNKMVSEDEDES